MHCPIAEQAAARLYCMRPSTVAICHLKAVLFWIRQVSETVSNLSMRLMPVLLRVTMDAGVLCDVRRLTQLLRPLTSDCVTDRQFGCSVFRRLV